MRPCLEQKSTRQIQPDRLIGETLFSSNIETPIPLSTVYGESRAKSRYEISGADPPSIQSSEGAQTQGILFDGAFPVNQNLLFLFYPG
ncbi:MAG: hypothetical protein KJ645_11725, partial [Planctomycetes bacterium]|nr:hypothetical protein [Planctomycetota bacterium]